MAAELYFWQDGTHTSESLPQGYGIASQAYSNYFQGLSQTGLNHLNYTTWARPAGAVTPSAARLSPAASHGGRIPDGFETRGFDDQFTGPLLSASYLRAGSSTLNLDGMPDQLQDEHAPIVIEKMGWGIFFLEVLQGTGVTVGLALLWGLENVRNSFFRLLDRLNLKPHRRRPSAFPPGRIPHRILRKQQEQL